MYARLPPIARVFFFRAAVARAPAEPAVILGTGFDLVDVARFSRVASRHDEGFVAGLFSEAERAWCARQRRPAEHLSARFAAREAALKALGTGLVGRMSWKDMEVVPGRSRGAVTLVLRGEVAAEAARQGVCRVHLALATTREVAAASVVLEG